jgi:transcriptional regulator with XRE-family HTH domain
MINISNIDYLIKKKGLKKTDIPKQVGYSLSGFNKAIKENSFKAEALLKLTEILGVDRDYFFEKTYKFINNDLSIGNENKVTYPKISTDDLLIKVISRLDRIIELLEKNTIKP